MTNTPTFLTREGEVTDILGRYAENTGRAAGALAGYEGHVMRMLNILRLSRAWSADDYRKLVIAAAFHDIHVFDTLDYLPPSVADARRWLSEHGLDDWRDEVELVIRNHHGVPRYSGRAAHLVEPFRRADWMEVSVGMINFGMDRRYLRELRRAIPYGDFYPGQIFATAFRWWRRHPFDPLPNFRTRP